MNTPVLMCTECTQIDPLTSTRTDHVCHADWRRSLARWSLRRHGVTARVGAHWLWVASQLPTPAAVGAALAGGEIREIAVGATAAVTPVVGGGVQGWMELPLSWSWWSSFPAPKFRIHHFVFGTVVAIGTSPSITESWTWRQDSITTHGNRTQAPKLIVIIWVPPGAEMVFVDQYYFLLRLNWRSISGINAWVRTEYCLILLDNDPELILPLIYENPWAIALYYTSMNICTVHLEWLW